MVHPTRNALSWEPLANDGQVPVLLVRHAQTAWNRERRMLGRSDIPLDEEGLQQADALADWLAPVPLSAVASSPLRRAMQTASPVAAARGLVVRPVSGLVELDQGELDGQLAASLLERYGDFFQAWRDDPGATRVPGGESLGECQERAWTALSEALADARPGPPVLIVVHQMVLSALLCRAMDRPLREYGAMSQRNTAINLLGWRDGALRPAALNLVEHLPPPPPPRRLPV